MANGQNLMVTFWMNFILLVSLETHGVCKQGLSDSIYLLHQEIEGFNHKVILRGNLLILFIIPLI